MRPRRHGEGITHLFYDLETSGLEPCWDIPLQAAFLRAEANLSVQRELTLRCRLLAHIVPSIDALNCERRSKRFGAAKATRTG